MTRAFTIPEAKKLAHDMLLAQRHYKQLHVPYLSGAPGIGKTSIVRELANDLGLEVHEEHIGESADAADITGIPLPDGEGFTWAFSPGIRKVFETPCLLFLDEFDKGKGVIQNALLQLVGKFKLRGQHLHSETLVIAAGNRLEDDKFSNEMSSAMKTRVTTIPVRHDFEAFCAWAKTGDPQRIVPEVLGFLQFRKELLHRPGSGARFPTPRGWEEASQAIDQGMDAAVAMDLKLEEGVGQDFAAWRDVVKGIDLQSLLYTDNYVPPTDIASVFATIYAVASALNNGVKKTMVGLPPYIQSLAPEHKMAFVIQCSADTVKVVARTFPEIAIEIVKQVSLATL